MEKIIRQELPNAQLKIIRNSLKALQKNLELLQTIEVVNHLDFDITTLTGLLKYKVVVELTEKEHTSFTHDNGVDFPEYL